MLKKQIIPIVRAFQSALPRGERLGVAGFILYCVSISIRAPARGATVSKDQIVKIQEFQSALPRGERRQIGMCGRDELNFNPRSREGSYCVPGAL